MAFGFAAHTSGLIVDRPGRAAAERRYLLDFASAYCDAAEVVAHAELAASPERFDADLLLTLEAGDRALAGAIGAQFVPCFPDPALGGVVAAGPGSEIRTAGAPLVRICLFGPESTGKSTLAASLARHYASPHVTEYVRSYLDATGRPGDVDDMPWIARGQRAAEIATARQAERVLVCDTNLATILLWSEVLFGVAPHWLREAALVATYDVWLLTGIDVPFEPDPQRCFPDPAERVRLMEACEGMLDRLGVTPVRLAGSHEARMRAACAAIDALLAARRRA
jgi:nicotinamide riboside kinase